MCNAWIETSGTGPASQIQQSGVSAWHCGIGLQCQAVLQKTPFVSLPLLRPIFYKPSLYTLKAVYHNISPKHMEMRSAHDLAWLM